MGKIDVFTDYSDKIKELIDFDRVVLKGTTLEPELIELINVYVSGINGCAYCFSAHSKKFISINKETDKLCMINLWQESNLFNPREKSALLLAKKITEIHNSHISDNLLQKTLEIFSEGEYIDLLFVIISINSFNRLLIGSGNSSV